MTKFSRVAKYEDLRNKLHNDAESDIKTNDLSDFANRLNKIDSNSFKAMDKTFGTSHDPIHAKREEYLTNTSSLPKPKFPTPSSKMTFDNEYLDEYISEVKQYNKDQGLIVSEDTSRNILSELYGDKVAPTIAKPYQSQTAYNTNEIPFQSLVGANPYSSLSDEDLERTRNDIASEVKNLINNKPIYTPEPSNDTYDYNQSISFETNSTKTSSIKNEARKPVFEDYDEDYEDNTKLEGTNRILNFVLIFAIFVLFIVLGFVIYYVLLTKGII